MGAEGDRVDDRTCLVQRQEGLGLRGLAPDVVAVGEQNNDAASLLACQQTGGEIDRVPECCARIRSDGERPKCVIRVDRRGRERALLRCVLAEGDEGDSIRSRLRGHEGGCRRCRLGKRLSGHRP